MVSLAGKLLGDMTLNAVPLAPKSTSAGDHAYDVVCPIPTGIGVRPVLIR